MPDYIPSEDAQFNNWANRFNTKIQVDPPAYSLTIGQATEYDTLYQAFLSAYQTAIDPATNSEANVGLKNTARRALKQFTRTLVRQIQGAETTTDFQRDELDIPIRDRENTPVPRPETAPIINVVDAVGTYVTIDLRDAENSTSRAKPFGVSGAPILTAFGPTAPLLSDESAWTWKGTITRTTTTLNFPGAASGTTVWITAVWQNTRGESGPPTQPISAQIPGQATDAA